MLNLGNFRANIGKFGRGVSKFGMGVGKFYQGHTALVNKGMSLLAEQSLPTAIEFAKQIQTDYEHSKLDTKNIEGGGDKTFEELYSEAYPSAQ